MQAVERTYIMTPGEVQRSLGVSASGLRRLASAYEDVHGPLGKDPHGARLFTGESVERLRAARALLSEGRARSVKDGLNFLRQGTEPSPVPPEPVRGDSQALEVIEVVIARLESLQEEVRGLRSELREARALPSDTASEQPAQGATGGASGVEGGVIVRAARRLEQLLGRRQR